MVKRHKKHYRSSYKKKKTHKQPKPCYTDGHYSGFPGAKYANEAYQHLNAIQKALRSQPDQEHLTGLEHTVTTIQEDMDNKRQEGVLDNIIYQRLTDMCNSHLTRIEVGLGKQPDPLISYSIDTYAPEPRQKYEGFRFAEDANDILGALLDIEEETTRLRSDYSDKTKQLLLKNLQEQETRISFADSAYFDGKSKAAIQELKKQVKYLRDDLYDMRAQSSLFRPDSWW